MTHKTYSYILDPQHEITVVLIGVGGTGSQVLNILARMHVALKALGHPGFHVTAYDADEVSESNIGRQSFWITDVGDNKAQNLISKINLAFGLNWDARTRHYNQSGAMPGNIIISCTDTIKSRNFFNEKFKKLSQIQKEYEPYNKVFYWLDFGNSATHGQAVLASYDGKLKSLFDLFPEMATIEESNEPSCSMQEALAKQDLLINSTLANLGMQLIWQLFRNLEVDNQGVFLNLADFSISKIPIK